MPPPKQTSDLLEGADRSVGTALDLVEGHIGQAGVAIRVERPHTERAIEILDGKNGIADSLAVGGIATSGADIFDRLESNINDLETVHGIGFGQGSELGFVILLELLTLGSEFFEGQAGDGGVDACGNIGAGAVNECLGLDAIGSNVLDGFVIAHDRDLVL